MGKMSNNVSDKTVGRLSLYYRLLSQMEAQGKHYVHSHSIASDVGMSAAQVRRDLMVIGYSGSPNRGYHAKALMRSIEDFLYDPAGQKGALVGVGNLGRAILSYLSGRCPRLQVVASFDQDVEKLGRVIHNCPCHPVANIPSVVQEMRIHVGIVTVPANAAQEVAEKLIQGGVRGILNFAPCSLRVPPGVFVEDVDVASAVEKVAYFARRRIAVEEIRDDYGA
jgi:redox-sensing transcriptional repressor